MPAREKDYLFLFSLQGTCCELRYSKVGSQTVWSQPHTYAKWHIFRVVDAVTLGSWYATMTYTTLCIVCVYV